MSTSTADRRARDVAFSSPARLSVGSPPLRYTIDMNRRLNHRADRLLAITAMVAFVLFAVGCQDSPPSMNKIKASLPKDYPDVSHVSTSQVAAWLEDADEGSRPILLDIREPAEFRVSHLRGAHNAPPQSDIDSLATGPLKGVAKDRRIVLYCSVGIRSSKYARRLQGAGYTNVHNLSGSIFDWVNEGRPVYSDRGVEEKVHPYNDKWGQLISPENRADLP